MKTSKVNAQLVAYYVRQAFEEGYRSNGGCNGKSTESPSKGKWFDHWLNCDARQVLVENGLINQEDDYR